MALKFKVGDRVRVKPGNYVYGNQQPTGTVTSITKSDKEWPYNFWPDGRDTRCDDLPIPMGEDELEAI